MKKFAYIILIAILIGISTNVMPQGVAINTTGNDPDNSAMLDVSSTTKGLLIPRMTKTERDAISGPVAGLMVYQTDNTPGYYFYNGASWGLIGSGAFAIDDLSDGKTIGNCVFLGSGAGANDDGADKRNVAIGIDALTTNTEGCYNTAIGYASLYSNATNIMLDAGICNTAIGYASSYSNRAGRSNIAIGYCTDYFNQDGWCNTIIGYEAGKGSALHNKTGNVFMGYKAGYNETGDNKLYIENSNSASPLIYGDFSTDLLKFNGAVELANGTSASSLKFYEPSGSGTHFTTFQSQAQAVDVTYTLPAADGSSGQMLQTDGSGVLSWATDVGAAEINDLTDGKTGGNSVFLGSGAGAADDGTDNKNVAVGIEALNVNTTGDRNTATGFMALSTNLSGSNNTANGNATLRMNLSGNYNTANGGGSLNKNTIGHSNTASGYYANFYNEEGSNNTIIGCEAGRGTALHNKSGNIFLGYQAGYNETGDNKLYIENSNSVSPLIYGDFATDLLKFNGVVELANGTSASSLKFYEPSGSGTEFTAFQSQSQAVDVTYTLPAADGSSGQLLQTDGSGALNWATDGGATEINDLTDGKTDGECVFLGLSAGANDDGSNNINVAVGDWALYTNTSGIRNTAIGYTALGDNLTGGWNTAIGCIALRHTKGSWNTAIGYAANQLNVDGTSNTIIGCEAGMGTTSHNKSGNIFLGYQAGYSEHGSNKLYIENTNSASPLIYGDFATNLLKFNGTVELANGISASSLKFYEPSGSGTHFTAFQSQAQAVDVTYTLPAADGSSGQVLQTDGSGALSWSNASGVTDIDGLTDGKTGGNSVFLGWGAGYNDDASDNRNVAVGIEALNVNTTGDRNTATGFMALSTNISGSNNTANGNATLRLNSSGNYNTANGGGSLNKNTSGHSNTASGYYANFYNEEGSNNTIIGCEAGMGSAVHNKSGNVFLGYQAGYNETGDNKLYIENSNSATPLIYGDFATNLLKFNGTLELANGASASSLKFYEPNGTNFTSFQSQAQVVNVTYTLPASDGSSGQVLQTDGIGTLSWSNASGVTDINGLTDGKTGGNSVFLGSGAGTVDDGTDNQNVAVGVDALEVNNTGNHNTAIGYKSLSANTLGGNNTGNGRYALCFNTEGNGNTAYGCSANYYNVEGSNNTIIGFQAGFGASPHNKTGNVFLGYRAGHNEHGSHKLYIETSLSSTPLIYGEFDNDLVTVYGNLGVGTNSFGGGTTTLALFNGAVPSASISDGVLLYSEGSVSELKVRDESGFVTTLSPHNFSLTNKSEPMAWSFYSENSAIGKKINVDMLRAVRLIEKITGEKLAFVQNIEDGADNTDIEESTMGIIEQQQQDIEQQQRDIDELKKLNSALLRRIEKLEE